MRAFTNFRIVGLIAVFLVIIAGSVVRMTGSGMGCPDWPKCFGHWVPPTSAEQLPDDYQDIYSEKREKKIQKFASFLESLGFDEKANQLKNDPSLLVEQPFNVSQTYTEYVNRLFGFLAGNFILIGTIWALFYWKRRKDLFLLSLLSLVIISIQAWFGSIVVATNLVPWTISVHMILALVTLGLEAFIIHKSSPTNDSLKISKSIKILFLISFAIIIYQILMGVQVRQQVDHLIDDGFAKGELINGFDIWYYIHRSFSWIVLLIYIYIFVKLKSNRNFRNKLIVILACVGLEFITGLVISYFDFPMGTQPIHLLAATIIFTLQLYMMFQLFGKNTPKKTKLVIT